MVESVRQNQTALSLVELYGVDNDFLPCEIFSKVRNELGIIESTVCVETLSINLYTRSNRENTYLHDLVSDSFIWHGVNHMTEESVGSFDHSI